MDIMNEIEFIVDTYFADSNRMSKGDLMELMDALITQTEAMRGFILDSELEEEFDSYMREGIR